MKKSEEEKIFYFSTLTGRYVLHYGTREEAARKHAPWYSIEVSIESHGLEKIKKIVSNYRATNNCIERIKLEELVDEVFSNK